MNRKYSAHEIEEKLRAFCVTEDEFQERMGNVTEIVESRIMATIADRTPENVKQFLADKSPEEIGAYFAEHPEHIGMISIDEIHEIEDRTWENYFDVMMQ